MAAKRYDVCSPRSRKDSDKTFWHRVGTAWEGEKGIGIEFDSLPIPDKDGRVSVRLFEPKERGSAAPQRQQPAQRPIKEEMDDEIPF